jgi:DNA-binding protein HU-beta
MNKPELLNAVAERAGVQRRVADQVIGSAVAVIREALMEGESVRIPGLGILYVKQRPQRLAMNPRTGMTITLPARKIIKFKIAKDLKRNLNGGKK